MPRLLPYFASCLVVASAPSFAQETLNSYQSFTGFTGLINTTNAETQEVGSWGVGYNNMVDYYGNNYVDGHNFIFSAGLLEDLEVSGLIATNTIHDVLFTIDQDDETQIRDLSFNAKYQIPLIPKDWFSLSVGMKDIGGAANHYKTQFAVASKEWQNFRFSLGVANSEHSKGMMNGAFGGVEWIPTPWLGFQVEYDAEAVNTAVRFSIPKEWLFDLGELTLTSRFYSSTDYAEEDVYWGANFIAPFSNEYRRTSGAKLQAAPAPIKSIRTKPTKLNTQQKQDNSISDSTQNQHHNLHGKAELNNKARQLRNMLIADGFESVRVGFNQQPVVVISFENAVFNRNELDALGLVAGRVAEKFSGSNAKFVLQLLNHGLPMLFISGDVQSYNRFLYDGIAPNLQVKMGEVPNIGGVSWVGLEVANQPYYKPRVTLSPELSSTQATELGVFDYSLALKADVTVPIWQGAGFNVSAQTVVHESDDFEERKAFDSRSEDNGVSSAFFYQTFQLPWGFYNQTKIGFFREFHKYTALINETAWVSPEGNHTITNTYGIFDYRDYGSDRDYHTVSYQYNWVEKELSFHATGGKFWRDDEGFKLETRFWFGDSYVAIYGQKTNAKVAGVAVSIPLSKRKSMNVGKFGQVKGAKAWRHQVGTRIGETHNYLTYQQAYTPKVPVSLDKNFFNQGRSSVDYVFKNLPRLKDAYFTYR